MQRQTVGFLVAVAVVAVGYVIPFAAGETAMAEQVMQAGWAVLGVLGGLIAGLGAENELGGVGTGATSGAYQGVRATFYGGLATVAVLAVGIVVAGPDLYLIEGGRGDALGALAADWFFTLIYLPFAGALGGLVGGSLQVMLGLAWQRIGR